MIRFRLGCVGYAYKDWRGPFYPIDLPQRGWLGDYAARFDLVELNTTFHAAPTHERIAKWKSRVGPGFTFALKMSRAITHDRPIEQGIDDARDFVRVATGLGEKLGPILIQLPPTFAIDQFASLEKFLSSLPTAARYAVEFRHESWIDARATGLLAAHNVAWVGLDHLDHPRLKRLRRTADFLYVRLIGRHGRFQMLDREVIDVTSDLKKWHAAIAREARENVREVFVIFNNDYAGHAPATLRRFAEIANIPLARPTQNVLFAS